MLTYRIRHWLISATITTKDKLTSHAILATITWARLVHVGLSVRMVFGVHHRFVQVCRWYQNRFKTSIFFHFWKVSPVCSVSELQSALVNVEIISNSLSASADGGVLADGWIQLQCAPDFNLDPSSGSLNVTCQATGRWATFPICSWSTPLLSIFMEHVYSLYSLVIVPSLINKWRVSERLAQPSTELEIWPSIVSSFLVEHQRIRLKILMSSELW